MNDLQNLRFQFYHIPTTILIWSHTLRCRNNIHRKQGKSIYSDYMDTIV